MGKKRLWACTWGKIQVRLMHQPISSWWREHGAQTQAGGARAYRELANHSTIYASSRSKLLTNSCAPSSKSRDPAIQRAQETGEPRTSLERKADAFDEQGMVSLFASRPRKQPQETARSLPPDMRQFIVDLRVEMPNMSIREIVEICDTRFHRRPSHHSSKTVLASGPPPSIQMRRFPLFNDTPDPAQRRHNLVQLPASGWSVASIAAYLQVSEQTVYTTLKRWWQEGVKGLDDKSHAKPRTKKGHA